MTYFKTPHVTLRPTDAAWPQAMQLPLNHTHMRPLLYVQGESPVARLNVTVIGTREMSPGAARRIERTVARLAELDPEISLTSGLALGCDGHWHRLAVQHKLHTSAVMAAGLDRIDPSRHRDLARDILDSGGALVTDRPEGSTIQGRDFVRRDGVQAAMGHGLILAATAADQGGSWHATRAAAALGRPVAWFEAPEDDQHPKWSGNRALSAAWHQARGGRPQALQALLRVRHDPHRHCMPISGGRGVELFVQTIRAAQHSGPARLL